MQKRGKDYVALCPFHDERTPSFTVIPHKNAFYCFGCQVGGSPIDWVMKYENVSFQEAVSRIAERDRVEVTRTSAAHVPAAPKPDRITVLRGRVRREPVLPLDQKQWAVWNENRLGAVEKFAELRRLPAELLRANGLVDVDADTVGFTYRSHETGEPCMVKVRSVEGKKFYLVPSPPKTDDDPMRSAKALMPLYLGHDLAMLPGQMVQVVVITEGETDALTLRAAGFRNVVSLPQGSGSAKYADLTPLMDFHVWLLSTDADTEGSRAAYELSLRARQIGVDAVRITWQRMVGEELVQAKDANDFRKGGAEWSDFALCTRKTVTERLGYFPEVFTADIQS